MLRLETIGLMSGIVRQRWQLEMGFSIIAAVSENNVIGKNGELPWPKIKEDMKRFRKITGGKVVMMGRKTFESIGKPLPSRTNIVISSDKRYKPGGVITVQSVIEARFATYGLKSECFVIGGERVYEEMLDFCDKMYLTHLEKRYEGDRRFPIINWGEWDEVLREEREGYRFANYVRRRE
jgi:dihydrofolate reductase